MQLIPFKKLLSYIYDKKRKIFHIFCENIAQSSRIEFGENDKRGCKKSADRIKPDIARGSVGLISL